MTKNHCNQADHSPFTRPKLKMPIIQGDN